MLTDRPTQHGSRSTTFQLSQLGCFSGQGVQGREDASDAAGSQPVAPTSYRLPKLQTPRDPADLVSARRGTARPQVSFAGDDVVYTRYGYASRSLVSRDFERGDGSPCRAVYPGPTFTQAVVTPVWSPAMMLYQTQREPSDLRARFQSLRSKTNCSTTVFSAFGSTIPRAPTVSGGWRSLQPGEQQQQQQQLAADTGSAFATEEKPVEWVMKPQRRFHVDRKGQQRNQGPFSREFLVHARPPQSWLRKKWGATARPAVSPCKQMAHLP